jgi:K+-transporting ATPase ATPase B chain
VPSTIEKPKISESPRTVPLPPDSTSLIPTKLSRSRPLFDGKIVRRATRESFVKLNPATLIKNPVIFVVEVGAALVTVFLLRDIATGAPNVGFEIQIALWLWFTVLFANFAEAMAEARGNAQADALRRTKTDAVAKRLVNGSIETVPASTLRSGDCDRRIRRLDSGRWRSD